MRNIVLAILAVALAAPAPSAMAAEGDSDRDDDAGVKQPTMRELANKIDQAVRRLATLEATVGTLATATAVDALTTEVRTHASAATANHATIVGKFAPQMAVVMTVPRATAGAGNATYYLVGESTIPGFPAGTVAANGQITATWNGRSVQLPAGTYLFELQQPYGDNAICQRSTSTIGQINVDSGPRRNAVCPRVFMVLQRAGGRYPRLNDGFGIYTITAPTTFFVSHRFPTGLTFTDDKPMASYAGGVRITKLK